MSLVSDIATTAPGNVTFNQTSIGTYTHVISGSGSLSLIGGSILTLSASNSYNGNTNVNAGTLALSVGGSIASSGQVNLTAIGATFDISGTTSGTTINDLVGAIGSVVTLGSKTLTLGTMNSTTFSGDIGGSSGSIIKDGTGTLTLNGNNTYTGGTTISTGALQISSSTGLSSGNVTDNASLIFTSGASGASIAQTISGTGSLTVQGGIITFSGNNAYSGQTTISGGTLALSVGGSIASSSEVDLSASGATFDISGTTSGTTIKDLSGVSGSFASLGSKTLTLGTATASTTFAGVIQDSSLGGGISKNGTGSLILTAVNTYTGITTINAGKIILSGSGSVSGSSEIDLTASGATFDISGTTSGTTINDLVGVTGSVVALGSKTLTLGTGTSTTFSGVIQDAGSSSGTGGSITKNGSGTLTLGGPNTYSGTTSVTAGTLRALANNVFSPNSSHTISSGATLNLSNTTQTIAGLNGAGAVNLGLGQLTVNNTSVDDIYSGTMTGTGTLIKSGGAKLTINGTVNLTGISSAITVQAGQMNVNAFAAANTFTVASGAILGGTGTITVGIGTPLSVLGTVSPGASIGTLTVINDITFGGNSTLNIEVSPTASDQLDVSGTANVTGATLVVTPFPGSYSDGTVYDIVVAGNVISPFAAVNIASLSATRQFVLNYDLPNLIQLIVESAPFTNFVSGGNAGATAAAFDTLNPLNPDVIFLSNFLDEATAAQLQCDFDQMQLALFNAIPITQETATTALRSIFSDRMREIHGTHCERELLLAKGDGLWLAPIGSFSKQMSRSQNGVCDQTKIGFHSDTYGATVGIDGEVTESDSHNMILGGALSYAHTNLHWEQHQAKSEADSGFASLYATVFNKDFYLDLALMGAFVSFDAKRQIFLENPFEKIQRTAKHANNAGEFEAHVETGITFNTQCMQFRPFGMVDYLYIGEAGYRERGADSINLVVRNRFSDLLREEVGLSFSSWQDQETYAWSEELKLSYVHEERFHGGRTKLRFAGSTDRFEVKGFLPDRDLFAPSFSLNFYWPSIDFSVSAAYSGEFGHNWWAQTGSMKFLWRF